MQEILERLAASGIQLVPAEDLRGHFLFERDGYLALVESAEGTFGTVGNPGILTEHGFAVLVRQETGFAFVAKGLTRPATEAEAQAARKFASDLSAALNPQSR